jgi:hypothetical protein
MSTPEPSQRNGVTDQAVIAAVCATPEADAIDLMVHELPDSLITLGPHGERGCVLSATRRGWPITPGTFLGTDRRQIPRHRAPCRWCRWEDEDEVIVTVAQLLGQNEDLLPDYQRCQYRRKHSGRARQIVVVPRTTEDPTPQAAPLGSAQLPAAG